MSCQRGWLAIAIAERGSMTPRIVVTAYAIAPNRGSEPGVGWNWVKELVDRGSDVTVLTRFEHHAVVAQELRRLQAEGIPATFTCIPVGVAGIEKLVRGRGALLYPYVMLWQILAAVKAWRLHRLQPFAIAHHLTYGGIRIPSFLGLLGCTTILGPLGGGEHAPWRLIRPFGLKAMALEALRYLGNLSNFVNPLILLSFARSDHILVRTVESASFVPGWLQRKVRVVPDIGIEVSDWRGNRHATRQSELRMLFVGRFLYWKGGAMLLRSLAALVARGGCASLTMVGDGPERQQWQALAQRLAIGHRVTWTGRLEQSTLADMYASHDLFVFPSLHDSGGSVVLEAMASRLPVLCLDLGGAGADGRRGWPADRTDEEPHDRRG